MFDTIERARLSELHVKSDEQSQLRAIIAIHNTKFGPALGGCRCLEYPNDEAALIDAIRLAKGMSYKAALADVPQGGGKAVLIRPKEIQDRERYFEAFGSFVEELNGRYITAVDSGTSPTDMDFISHATHFVSGTSTDGADPSPTTALGVLEGIKACVRYRMQRESLEGIHVAIQGVGNVGSLLAKLLHQEGARLTVTDINPSQMERMADEFGAELVTPEQIYHVHCDVFSPCSLGSVLNSKTIPQLDCTIVAGSANNQLAEPHHGHDLYRREILYAPDYVINAGGLIHVALNLSHHSTEHIHDKTRNIAHTLSTILEKSDQERVPPHVIADQMAEEKLYH